MTEPIPSNPGPDNVIYPSKSTKVQTAVVSVTSASPMGSTTSPPDVPSSSSTGVPDVRQQSISTGSNTADPQRVGNNRVEAAGTTFDKTDERVLISVGSFGTHSCQLENQRAIANICRRWFCPGLLSDLDY